MARAVPLDAEILHARPLSHESSIAKRCRVHQLVLSVVFERHLPAVLSIGPPLDRKEPPEHVAAVETLLRAIATGLGLEVHSFGTERDLLNALDPKPTGKQIGRQVNKILDRPLTSRDRRVVLATATALAAVRDRLDTRRFDALPARTW